jgi:hypothetical protein
MRVREDEVSEGDLGEDRSRRGMETSRTGYGCARKRAGWWTAACRDDQVGRRWWWRRGNASANGGASKRSFKAAFYAPSLLVHSPSCPRRLPWATPASASICLCPGGERHAPPAAAAHASSPTAHAAACRRCLAPPAATALCHLKWRRCLCRFGTFDLVQHPIGWPLTATIENSCARVVAMYSYERLKASTSPITIHPKVVFSFMHIFWLCEIKDKIYEMKENAEGWFAATSRSGCPWRPTLRSRWRNRHVLRYSIFVPLPIITCKITPK